MSPACCSDTRTDREHLFLQHTFDLILSFEHQLIIKSVYIFVIEKYVHIKKLARFRNTISMPLINHMQKMLIIWLQYQYNWWVRKSLHWRNMSVRAFQIVCNSKVCSTVFQSNSKENTKGPNYIFGSEIHHWSMQRVIQYIPRNMHTVFALLCFVVVIHWLIFPYPSGLLHWHCGNLTIAPVPAKQPWWIWINTSCEFIMNDCITTTKQSTTKPCAYFLGYTVYAESISMWWRYYGLCQIMAFP